MPGHSRLTDSAHMCTHWATIASSASTLVTHPAADVHHPARPGPRITPGCPNRTPISCLLTDPLRRRDWLPQPSSGLLGVTAVSYTHLPSSLSRSLSSITTAEHTHITTAPRFSQYRIFNLNLTWFKVDFSCAENYSRRRADRRRRRPPPTARDVHWLTHSHAQTKRVQQHVK